MLSQALECASGPLLRAAELMGCAQGPVYGAAMTACLRRGQRARAWAIGQRARAKGVKLITLELNIALGAAARCGELDAALQALSNRIAHFLVVCLRRSFSSFQDIFEAL